MKSLVSKILILTLTLLMTGCFAEEDDGTGSDLPAITSEGANSFGCLINGQVFLPRTNRSCFDCAPLHATRSSYSQERNEGLYQLQIIANNNINGDVSIGIKLFLEQALEERVYELSGYVASIDKFNQNAWITIHRDISGENINSGFSTSPEVTGTFEVTEINEAERFIAGIFEFQAVDQNGEIVEITQGRFDLRVDHGNLF